MKWRLTLAAAMIGLPLIGLPLIPAVQAATDVEDAPSAFREAAAIGFSGEAIQGGVILGDAPAGTIALSLDGRPVPLDSDGKFLIAFNRDAAQSALLVATLSDGQQIRKFISVAPRNWKIEHVALARRATTSSPEFQARRAGELAQINAARRISADSKGWRQRFIWPAKGRISGVFGSQRIYNGDPGSYHSGIDIAAGAGAYYVAPADGVVTLAASSPFTLEGNLLMIDHGMGLNSAFLHSAKLLVKAGDTVKRGDPIGVIGQTGSATGPHLHWSMKWNDARIDPILLTGPME